MRDKIAEIAKMSHEELHAYRWELLSKIADIAKISYVQKLQILQKLYLKNYKKLMRDKIPEIGKMSPEELQGTFY